MSEINSWEIMFFSLLFILIIYLFVYLVFSVIDRFLKVEHKILNHELRIDDLENKKGK